MKTLDWNRILEEQLVDALMEGSISGLKLHKPDYHIETGLAHVFFFNERVFKLYKTHHELDHFIRGVFAPTKERTSFIEKDFALNRHFGGEVYKEIYSLELKYGNAHISPYDGSSIFVLFEMERLDFSQNLHEQLLRGEVDEIAFTELGRHVAELVDTAEVTIPDDLSWYSLAIDRVGFLTKFADWMEDEKLREKIYASDIFDVLNAHLEEKKDEYELLQGASLVVNIDCHDENIFFHKGKPAVIDILPPMSCWWYGIPVSNLCAIMTNIEVMHSPEAAKKVKRGFEEYYGTDIHDNELRFSRAFMYTISAVFFGSIDEKNTLGWKYAEHLEEVAQLL